MSAPRRSDALVFFGATGDLAYKQIFPALQALVRRGALDMPVVGVAKSGWTLEQLRARARDSLEHHGGLDRGAFEKLIAVLRYVDGDYAEATTFERLRRELGNATRPLHYYCEEAGVSPDSNVETFAAAELRIESWRWAGVPFFVRAGKCLPVSDFNVRVQLRRPPLDVYRERIPSMQHIRFSVWPKVSALALGVHVKRPGEGVAGRKVELLASQDQARDMLAYERLLGDALNGDANLFAQEDAIEAQRRIVDPVLDLATPPHPYAPGSWGPPEADRLVGAIEGGWDQLSETTAASARRHA